MFVTEFHPSFTNQPENDDVLWRYMDLARFLSLLEDEAIYFARADQMSDKWEGSYSQANVDMRPQLYGELFEDMNRQYPIMHESGLKTTHVNCWHESPVESAAMWDIYQREGRGVAVRTTWKSLVASIGSDRSIFGGRVNYVDYRTTFIPEGNFFDRFMHKRLSFAHEREVRLIMMTGRSIPHPTEEHSAISLGPEPPVIPIPVDLKKLIQAVHVAPDAPDWVSDLIHKVCKRYGHGFGVRHSDLASDPIV
ncbi:DUF2971 domain-containing protein [Pseudarthrobacter sp. NCCP-2145]|uniref:DUF2971 domain-containing protein n=1 Tax=Pseudarthrobacter sp. NCCP-2145 TaxID=2942290 RepID=UPI00203C1C87|nr:DUF2971 domain-containing protein [Pseudarthrobacter sp. NCCP-2145]GKV71168.1 DUF2971 domain-containing protein [Pseudarthrobacter sp. NCCP-2145]